MLDKLQHPNLVRLVGYCSEKGEACLVYELCELGALDDALIKGGWGQVVAGERGGREAG